jgi:hypothetical protein
MRPARGGGSSRRVRSPFGVAICHEGWRYPETVRWAARRGAQVGTGLLVVDIDLAEATGLLAARCRTF